MDLDTLTSLSSWVHLNPASVSFWLPSQAPSHSFGYQRRLLLACYGDRRIPESTVQTLSPTHKDVNGYLSLPGLATVCPELLKMSAQAGIPPGGALRRKSAKVSLTISRGQSVLKLLGEGPER